MSLSNAPRPAAPRLLGAIIAGGRATRFAGDKGAALLDGTALIDHAAAAIAPFVDHVIVCGRDWPGIESVVDRPAPDLGPLGGIAAALHHARGHDAVLTIGCDMPIVPPALIAVLVAGGSRYCVQAPILACWDAALAAEIDAHIGRGGSLSIRGWADVAGARAVAWDAPLANVNTRADLAAL